ncbi:helix-turn-helix transcriptional regulator [Saccharopolyspora cebuensis]|uniref:Helix-turn-helix domain-containing protein n=1 Tax=Saccharopolyspora cebuensis TaxID=418759 RepID=A0ABV4CG91_9PSEU
MVLGWDLRAAREAAGLSLGRMALRTHFARSYLSMIETGKRPVVRAVVLAYEQVLGVPLADAPGEPLRVAHEWLLAEPPPGRAGRRIGGSDVAGLEARVVELRHLDDVVSSADLLPVITGELARAERLADDASCTEAIGRRLFTALGELYQLAGWVADDAGNHADARRHYLTGVRAANNAHDRVLGAQLLSSLSYQIANVGDPVDASLLARTAVRGADGATPVVRTLLLERAAWAAARSGDAELTWRTLDAVDDTYDRRGGDEPEWTYWLDRGEIDVMAARCMVALGRPRDAAPLLAHAISGYPAEHAREVALYLTWLAESHARAGELDAARSTLAEARRRAAAMPSARTAARIREVHRLV